MRRVLQPDRRASVALSLEEHDQVVAVLLKAAARGWIGFDCVRRVEAQLEVLECHVERRKRRLVVAS